MGRGDFNWVLRSSPGSKAGVRRRMTFFFAFHSFSSRKWRSHCPGPSLQRDRRLWTPDNRFAISGDLGIRASASAARPPQRFEKRNTRVARRVFRDAGYRVFVCFASTKRRAARFFCGGRESPRPASPSAFRQSLNSQGISASDWRLAVRRDVSPLVRRPRIPGTAFSVPRATGSEAPRMTANTGEYGSVPYPV